ncbi:hypothetical protein SAMN04487943_10798 [Gracilibacillus orientalis]|uniref:Uncharacterized protein n=1 Tax=Gracilibacillus orientalis TaxID=334253 RepID=A0A1I4MUS3_9BACI|nr:hypothetical protein [Gracilibacillus orientalis]SFM06837.1 hypothetical protein SAMN04487943_10798 [Gracilibacillus orientalis]
MSNHQEIQQKLIDWQEEQSSYLDQIKGLIQDLGVTEHLKIICYFTSSYQLFHQEGRENYGIGSFHIQNVGEKPLTNPHIGLKITSNIDFHFSGKYLYPNSKQTRILSNAWERVNEPSDKKEFWLRPTQNQIVEPGETLTFSNFQIKWMPTSTYSGTIQGFTYGNELPDGINSLNQISLNGSVADRQQEGDIHEKE